MVDHLYEQIEELQQWRDEVIVALGSEGLLPSEVVDKIKSLSAENSELKRQIAFYHLHCHARPKKLDTVSTRQDHGTDCDCSACNPN